MNSLYDRGLFLFAVLCVLFLGAMCYIAPMPDSAFKTINEKCVSPECIALFVEYYQDETITPFEYFSLQSWFHDATRINELKARELLKAAQ